MLEKRTKTGGRKKGTPNHNTTKAKDAIVAAAEGLGGVPRLIAWAKSAPENERVFWGNIYPKLIPVQLTGEGDGPLLVELVQFANKTAGK